MFVGHTPFDKGDIVLDSDLLVPLFEIEWHTNYRDMAFLWDDYSWESYMVKDTDQEVELWKDVTLCSSGIGSVTNSKLGMANIFDTEATRMGMSGVSSESPGAGAFTPYYGRQFEASQYMAPGKEVFVDYGEDYFQSRQDYAEVPRSEDYILADQLLERFRFLTETVPALMKTNTNTTTTTTTSSATHLSEDLYRLMVQDQPYKSRVLFAMPSNASTRIDDILMTGGTVNATFNESIRSLEWLEEHGRCIDHIKDGVSTLPHAGRGAFANRFIPKGGLVAPAPLIHIGDRDVLTMYRPLPEKRGKRQNTLRALDEPTHQQLLLNYCFGHKDTTLLLCPYGSMMTSINHSHDHPNVRVQWSSPQNMRHPEWLNQTYLAWYRTMHAGLSFDVIALRDIEEDEEIFMDYGVEWETAWQEHVASFDVPRRGYVPAFEMNDQMDLPIKTIFETDYELIDGISTYCRKHMVDLALRQEVDDEEEEEEDGDEKEVFYRCRVVHRNHKDSYIAEVFSRVREVHPSGMWNMDIDEVKYVLFDVPRDTFYFRDAAYERDHHQEWSFRHEMQIPDDLLPDAWRVYGLETTMQGGEETKKEETVVAADSRAANNAWRVEKTVAQNESARNLVGPNSPSGRVCVGAHESP